MSDSASIQITPDSFLAVLAEADPSQIDKLAEPNVVKTFIETGETPMGASEEDKTILRALMQGVLERQLSGETITASINASGGVTLTQTHKGGLPDLIIDLEEAPAFYIKGCTITLGAPTHTGTFLASMVCSSRIKVREALDKAAEDALAAQEIQDAKDAEARDQATYELFHSKIVDDPEYADTSDEERKAVAELLVTLNSEMRILFANSRGDP